MPTNLNTYFTVTVPNQSSIGDKGGIGSVPPGGGTADPMGDPDKLFYENLPFHGMQNPPNKVDGCLKRPKNISMLCFFYFCML